MSELLQNTITTYVLGDKNILWPVTYSIATDDWQDTLDLYSGMALGFAGLWAK